MRTARLVALAFVTACSPGAPFAPDGEDDAAPAAAADAGPSTPDAAPAPLPPPDAAPAPLHDPREPGPWAVGVRTVELVDASRSRKLLVDVWYPVDPAAPDGKKNRYELEAPLVGAIASIETPARRNATPAAGGPWPLVVFSHGYGGVRFQSYFLTEHLASHGFVVAAPDHSGNTLLDLQGLGSGSAAAQSAIDRPLDVLFVTDRLLDGTAGVPLALDAERVGVTGHSFGGWTALEVTRRDGRFRVAFPMAPGFRNGSTPDFVADLGRPIAIFGGSEDDTCPFESDQRAPYELAQPPKLLVELLGAGHLDFSNLCEVPLAAQLVDDGCDPAKIPPAEVHARTRAIATAFARRHLAGEPGYDAYLEPAFVLALGRLDYWREAP